MDNKKIAKTLTADNRLGRERATSALKLLFCGDALSMPVHWFYRPSDIVGYFPPAGISRMEAAPTDHPGAIMNLHSTQRGGRKHKEAKQTLSVVGDIILKDKAHLWNTPGIHYHHAMQAGENTLNACLARHMMNWITSHGEYDLQSWLESYEDFMTAVPARHHDTYAESYHREFFSNRAAGKALKRCGGSTHDTPSMGALVTLAPLALALFSTQALEGVKATCREHVYATHPDKGLLHVVDNYVELIHHLITRENDCGTEQSIRDASKTSITPSIEKLVSDETTDRFVVGQKFSLACYISDSWPSVCYLANKYCRHPVEGLLANTNLGGENAHRGAVLGSIIGLVTQHKEDDLFRQLQEHDQIKQEMDTWLNTFYSATENNQQ